MQRIKRALWAMLNVKCLISNVKRLTPLQTMKEEENKEIRVRPMSKMELAMLYAPNLTPQGAVNRLIDWIRHNPELTESLLRTGYRKSQKLLTSLQVRIIFDYLGEP